MDITSRLMIYGIKIEWRQENMTEFDTAIAAEKTKNKTVNDDNMKSFADFTEPEILYQELLNSIKKYHPSADLSLVEKAFNIADGAHKGQVRKSGEPYIIHPLSVAIILADLELDKESIVAGLLHDVVEDTVMTSEEIAEEFGEEVALLVDGGTVKEPVWYQ